MNNKHTQLYWRINSLEHIAQSIEVALGDIYTALESDASASAEVTKYAKYAHGSAVGILTELKRMAEALKTSA